MGGWWLWRLKPWAGCADRNDGLLCCILLILQTHYTWLNDWELNFCRKKWQEDLNHCQKGLANGYIFLHCFSHGFSLSCSESLGFRTSNIYYYFQELLVALLCFAFLYITLFLQTSMICFYSRRIRKLGWQAYIYIYIYIWKKQQIKSRERMSKSLLHLTQARCS